MASVERARVEGLIGGDAGPLTEGPFSHPAPPFRRVCKTKQTNLLNRFPFWDKVNETDGKQTSEPERKFDFVPGRLV